MQSFFFDDIKVVCSPQWGSRKEGHRKALRQYLYEQFEDAQLLDLNSLPNLSGVSLSISHTLGMGVVAHSSKYHRIGVDVECSDRLHVELIQRVSCPSERKVCGAQVHFLWSLKEAAFKVLGCGVMSDYKVVAACNDKGFLRVDIEYRNHKIRGGGFEFQGFTLAWAALNISVKPLR